MTKAPKPGARTRHDRRADRAADTKPIQVDGAQIAPLGDVGLPTVTAAGVFRPTLHQQIRADPENPRKLFDEDGAAELAASIVRDGLIEPLVIRAIAGEPDAFMLIAGERRWRAIGAAIAAGDWPADRPIPAMLREVSEQDARRLALVENLQRRDLNAVEEARALQQLADLTGATAAQIGRDLGFTERWAQQRLSLLKLPEGVQHQVETGAITVQDGRELVALLPKLPAVQQIAIAKGVLSVQAAKDWLAKQPKPLDLSIEQWLLALEVYDKTQRTPLDDGGRSVEVHADARFDDRVAALTTWPGYLLHAVSHILEDGGETGQFQIGVGYDGERQLKIKFGDGVATDRGRLAALDALYAELGVAYTPPLYRTTWLNGPFEISEGLRKEIVEARQARAIRDAQWKAEREAEDAQRAADQAAKRQRLDRAAWAARELLAGTSADYKRTAPAIAAELAAPLPWWLDREAGVILAADGHAISPHSYGISIDALAKLQLMVTLANAGAGLETPAKRPARLDPDAPTREAFVFQVAAALIEAADDEALDDAGAQAQAERGLVAYLVQEDIAYGEDGYDWGPDHVESLAAGIRRYGFGQQVDLEAAIDATMSPALLALAGVPAQVSAE